MYMISADFTFQPKLEDITPLKFGNCRYFDRVLGYISRDKIP